MSIYIFLFFMFNYSLSLEILLMLSFYLVSSHPFIRCATYFPSTSHELIISMPACFRTP